MSAILHEVFNERQDWGWKLGVLLRVRASRYKRAKGRIERALEWFLQLPGLGVLAALWLLGAALISLFVLASYFLVQLLWILVQLL